MGATYTQLLVHIIFAVQNRNNLIKEINRNELEKYICGIIANNKCKTLAIYCNPDHVHILAAHTPEVKIADLVRDIKANSSRMINEKRWIAGKFNWQDGYGAFTCAKSQLDRIGKYILNQPIHHKKKDFKEEYLGFLEKCGIKYNVEYLFNNNAD